MVLVTVGTSVAIDTDPSFPGTSSIAVAASLNDVPEVNKTLSAPQAQATLKPILSQCSEEETQAFRRAYILTGLQLTQAMIAADGPLYDFFFARMPGKAYLSNLFAKILRGGRLPSTNIPPTIVCATSVEKLAAYPKVELRVLRQCFDKGSYFVAQPDAPYHALFLCKAWFREQVTPSPVAVCPQLRNNRYLSQGEFPVGQSSILLIGLAEVYASFVIGTDNINQFWSLNIAIQGRQDYTFLNIGCFLYMALNGCNQVSQLPDLTKPPWNQDSGRGFVSIGTD
ncbi:uncharacterized protein KY384_007506 [Bacidia gigantensis]|uniref:uncharacterized protein n=1 Tax=Bacidia gigantensis TaxID=2732470 RepID=UPI001D04B7D2|nr:uncharacterized protein KY384_007506 [Bacidia gigantensis]KAG8527354.1 hypothetical protein KY384_007506 [Bacidia gigantensis]